MEANLKFQSIAFLKSWALPLSLCRTSGPLWLTASHLTGELRAPVAHLSPQTWLLGSFRSMPAHPQDPQLWEEPCREAIPRHTLLLPSADITTDKSSPLLEPETFSSTKWSVLSQKHSWEESQHPENGVLWVPRMLLLHGFLPYGGDYLFCCCFNWEKKEVPTRLSSHCLHGFQEACGGGEGTSRAWGSKGTWIKHGCEPVRKGGPAALLHGVPSCRRVLPRPRGNTR